jgi:hypothetical protein
LDSCAGRPFAALVDSNAAFMRADERYSAGEFATANDAVTKARTIIDEDLAAMARANPGIDAQGLVGLWELFASDPCIPGVDWSAVDYARRRCEEIAADS